MKARQLQTKVWRDGFFLKLSPSEKLLFVFYFTNEFVNIIHLYECPDHLTSFSTGLSVEEIKKAKSALTDKILFFEDYVFLKNAWKYERYEGTDNENAKAKLIDELSPNIKDWYKKNSTPLLHPSDRDKNKNKNKNYNKNRYPIIKEEVSPSEIPF
jgi:hypothetical protein